MVLRAGDQARGKDLHVWDIPDPGYGDRNKVKRLNEILVQDPEAPMPEGYKKVLERDLNLEFKIPQELDVSESRRIVIELLDGILFNRFQFHFLEPLVNYPTFFRAKGVLLKPDMNNKRDDSPNVGMKRLSTLGLIDNAGLN
jgi:hypothetical protein